MAGQIQNKRGGIEVQVEVGILKEGKQYVAYCPALELSGYGDSIKDAKKSFETVMAIFLEDTSKKGTLEKILVSLGWTLKRSDYKPPKKVSYETLVALKSLEYISQKVHIPA